MRFLKLIFGLRTSERHLTTLVRTLSDACQSEVWDRVRGHIFEMEIAEARGYVRARAMAPIRLGMMKVVHPSDRLTAAQLTRLRAHATDRIVQRILSELVAGSPAGRRKAA